MVAEVTRFPQWLFHPWLPGLDDLLILLDEATSAVDPENEEAIQQAISALAVGRTLFVIAHNLSLIIAADRVILFEAGERHPRNPSANVLPTALEPLDRHAELDNGGAAVVVSNNWRSLVCPAQKIYAPVLA